MILDPKDLQAMKERCEKITGNPEISTDDFFEITRSLAFDDLPILIREYESLLQVAGEMREILEIIDAQGSSDPNSHTHVDAIAAMAKIALSKLPPLPPPQQ